MKSLKKRNELILKNGLNNGDKLRLRLIFSINIVKITI